MPHSLILASASPQRKELLAGLGVSFDVIPSRVDEADCPERDPAKRAQVLSARKARDVAKGRKDRWVLGSDTLVVAADGTLLEKPKDAADARRMIGLHSGMTCVVHSGLCLIGPEGKEYEGLSSSSVTFKQLSVAETDWWIDTGLWEGRSGGFQIDGLGQLLISHIEGDWTGIVGLPVYLFGELCRKAEAPFPFDMSP